MLNLLLLVSGGLLLFLTGMAWMQKGLVQTGQGKMKEVISAFTSTPFLATVTGALVTMVIQSSSAITVVTIGMINTGLMGFSQALGIVLGTNIGTTFTVQLIAFNFNELAPWFLALGLTLKVPPCSKIRFLGNILSGLGLIFYGLNFLNMAFQPFEHSRLFLQWMSSLGSNYCLALLTGLISTALLQSSAAITGLTIVLGGQGYLNLATAIAIMLGSNVGTCTTAIIASISGNLDSKRIAMAHVILNVLGVVLFFPVIELFSDFLVLTSRSLPRQIANGHTLFNLFSSALVLPFVPSFSKLIFFLIPEEKN